VAVVQDLGRVAAKTRKNLSTDGSEFGLDYGTQGRQMVLNRNPHVISFDTFVAVTLPAPAISFHRMDGCRALRSSGKRREASEMISRHRVTA
jgi:hypothetical protein